MPCQAPIQAFRPANGGPLLFNAPRNGRAYTPFQVPCGYCILCRKEHARQTAVRIYHEAQTHNISSFITLSYSDKHLPEHGSLQYADLRRFLDRMRKRLNGMRFYAVGEYGDKRQRPHYHACIFGHAFTEHRTILRTLPTLLWTNPYLEEAWGLGLVSVGALTFETARYTASYVTKKLRLKQKYVRTDEETGELIALQQPKCFMSRNLGRAWWEQFGQQVAEKDYVIIDGRRQKPPRAYDKWLKKQDEARSASIKDQRKANAPQLTPDQMRARARNAHAHEKSKSKSL